jgi:chemotaxis protein methyltransferase CheR
MNGVREEAGMGALSIAVDIDLGAYRVEHVRERIRRALVREAVADVDQLARTLRRDREARFRFRRAVAVPSSRLFRDEAQFSIVERRILPDLLERSPGRVRVWSAGCARGEELYSLALVLERMGALERAFLLGSDLLAENVATAAVGADVGSLASPTLRAALRWESRDLVAEPPPPGRWSLILCRNVGIYLAGEVKERVHVKLAGALTRGGYLMLGRAERLRDPAALKLERVAPNTYRRPA